jgi:cyclic pyranopterin phosphate synthase
MPEEGVALSADSALLTTSEVARLVSLFVRAGVSKVRFTGGEPTVRRDLVDVVRGANELRREGLRSIAMTTNGVVLAPRLPALLDAGLDALNVSLDTLDPRKFELITRRRGHERVLQAIRQAVACGRLGSRVKVNAVVVRGINDGEVADFVEWTRHEAVEVRARRGAARRVALHEPLCPRAQVRFIEYMPFDGNRWDKSKLVSYVEMVDRIRTRFGDAFRRLEVCVRACACACAPVRARPSAPALRTGPTTRPRRGAWRALRGAWASSRR